MVVCSETARARAVSFVASGSSSRSASATNSASAAVRLWRSSQARRLKGRLGNSFEWEIAEVVERSGRSLGG